ncbi:hypothetical protein LIER_29196 [Lithospermum erythrorhizon]|uniref:Uncharacterized protein n=1 Tax=Lithospermum erythrorhizon TaxID=34254 RepID=A0AAV3RLM3_LITER
MFIKEVYHLLQIPNIPHTNLEFRELFKRFKIILPANKFRLWIVCMWDVWYQRNRKYRGQPFRYPMEIVRFGEAFLALDGAAPSMLQNLLHSSGQRCPFSFLAVHHDPVV